ncbi:hypothetical protein AQUCO_03700340v1 [Aquilegia coerulea]|uniref:Uncharacterized protein n=1 Tax=Aquilegia coerulea TaxID=218851 RepID=A0A2G5CUT6_AQUCA|nr:hypothetical protein AQUCO_03700340v1 [Aquilegia coerulea]
MMISSKLNFTTTTCNKKNLNTYSSPSPCYSYSSFISNHHHHHHQVINIVNTSLKSTTITIVVSSSPAAPLSKLLRPLTLRVVRVRCQQQMQTPSSSPSSSSSSILETQEKEKEEENEEEFHYPSKSNITSSSSKEKEKEEGRGICGIKVPRQKYISVSKSDLLVAILSSFFEIDDIASRRDFTRFSDIAVASRFQRAFLKLLQDAQFEELSVRDLLLTSALNTDYLLTLPIYVDWKRASDSNAIVFRRGYATERQKGFLIVEKLDYLQSKLLQAIFFSLSKPLGEVAVLIKEAIESASQRQELQIWIERVKVWLKEPFSQKAYSDYARTFDNQLASNQLFVSDLPIWLAAQRAVPRYEGLLSPVGPRGRLLRRLLTWIGLIPSTPKTSLELNSDSTTSEPYLRPSFLSRITLSDIWRPATKEYCGNDFLKMLKTAISILFSQSTLQEPAFQELILLYNEKQGQIETEYKAEISSLKLKIYEKIPIPDLPVVFPDKKLSFRILDTVRLDVASILGLLAFLVNYKFEDILSSP